MRTLPTKSDPDATYEPVSGKGPTKGKRPPGPRKLRGKMRLKPPVKSAAGGSGKSPSGRARAGGGSKEPPDQQPARPRRGPGEQYVRLRVRVDNGQLSIVGSHLVDGPLAQSSVFEGAYAYEVTDGAQLLHAESMPDLGVFRAFAHPQGTVEQRRHHSYQLSTFEFNARVPAGALQRAPLSEIAVVLYRVKERTPIRTLPGPSAGPLGVQRGRELREVGRVVGIPAALLPSGLAIRPGRAAKRPRASEPPPKRGTKKP